jgi:hypothetical protein
MSYSFLDNKLKSELLLPHEIGNYGESVAAARLLFSTKGEVRWGSRNEDGRKIDIIFSCDHPWAMEYCIQMGLEQADEILLTLMQVKCGTSFALEYKKGFKIKYSVIKDVYRSTHPITLLWVNPINSKVFWAYLKPTAKGHHKIFGEHHILNPCFPYDLARCQISLAAPREGSGLILSPINLNDKALRDKAREFYKKYSQENVISPVLGKITFGQIGWRHILRRTRKLQNKKQSLKMMPVLQNILKHVPSSHIIKDVLIKKKGVWEHRYSTHLLEFNKVKMVDSNTQILKEIKVVLKVIEGIQYPSNWHIDPKIEGNIKREVKFYSCYYK